MRVGGPWGQFGETRVVSNAGASRRLAPARACAECSGVVQRVVSGAAAWVRPHEVDITCACVVQVESSRG